MRDYSTYVFLTLALILIMAGYAIGRQDSPQVEPQDTVPTFRTVGNVNTFTLTSAVLECPQNAVAIVTTQSTQGCE